MIKEVTIREYFSVRRSHAKECNAKTRYSDAHNYLKKYCNVPLKSTMQAARWIRTEAESLGIEGTELAAKLAFKGLNLDIENEMLEYAAEQGYTTLLAIEEDKQLHDKLKKAEEKRYEQFGYCTCIPRPTDNVDRVKKATQFYFVSHKARPLIMLNITNPYLANPDDDPFVDKHPEVDVLPFNQLTPGDYDKLSESEWKRVKEAAAQQNLDDRIAKIVAPITSALNVIEDNCII